MIRKTLPAVIAAAATFALATAPAQADVESVVTGNLNWSTVKLYVTPATTPPTDRTFVGFETRDSSPGAQNMTLTPSGAMWGTTVTPSSPSGTTVGWNFPVSGGVYDPTINVGTVATNGRLQGYSAVKQDATLVGFDYTLSVENPVIRFDGTDTAHLYASGTTKGGTATQAGVTVPYGYAELFTLDLTGATVTDNADGTVTVANMAPTVVTDVYGGFPAGSGPDRTPNTFGSFSLTFDTVDGQTGPKGDAGTNGADGVNGTNGTNGVNGTAGKNGTNGKSATRVIAYLRKAPWTGNKARKVSLLKNGKVVATGTIRSKTLNVTVAKGKRVAAGSYTLKAGTSKKSITIG